MTLSEAVAFAIELLGTLTLVGVAAGAAVAGSLNVAEDLVERGLIGRRR